MKLKAESENENISARRRARCLLYWLACATMLYMISENSVHPEPTAQAHLTVPEVQSRQKSEIGLGMARSKLGARSAEYPEVKEKHKARMRRSFLGRLHLEKKENG